MSTNILESYDVKEDTLQDRYLSFMLDNETYGIEIRYVTEIVGMHPITSLPEMPAYVKGIINLRGKVFPVLDVRLRFHKPGAEYTDRTCIIVVDMGDATVGLIVDRVAEVTAVSPEDITPPTDLTAGMGNQYIQGIGKIGNQVMLIIQVNNLIKDQEIKELNLEAGVR